MSFEILNTINIENSAREWRAAEPFPHIVIDNFLKDPSAINEAFPKDSWVHWKSLGDAYQVSKYSCSNLNVIPIQIQNVIRLLNEATFLSMLELVTGINGLIPDPYLEGGGLHLSLAGGILAPHSDFHVYARLNLYRRLNLILYANENWGPGDGGELELMLPEDAHPRKLIAPILNRAVIFETNDRSIHGFTQPIRNSTERRSIALYYYTSTETSRYSGDQTTHWRAHGAIPTLKKPRFWIYKFLMTLSRALSIAAQLINPNQGIVLVRTRLKQINDSNRQ